MVRIWNSGGVLVYATGISQEASMNVGIEGFAQKGAPENTTIYKWVLWSTPQGFIIETRSSTDKTERFTGVTHNMGLEVAKAVKQAL